MSRARGPRGVVARSKRWARRLPPVARAADATRDRRAAVAVRRSGWFDADWYREVAGGACPPGADPVAHYLAVGAAAGLPPHPLFDPAYYLAHSPAARRSAAEPFTEFLTRGAQRGDDPHPLFDTAAYLEQAPEAADHPGGAFGHYLEHGARRGHWPSRELRGWSLPPTEQGDDPYLDLARRAQRAHLAHRRDADFTDLERSTPDFDHQAAEDFVARMRAHAARLAEPPLVSVVMPTRDRAGVLPRAIESVLGQTYPHLELLIVDDGSTDDTAEVVDAYDDGRLRYLPQDNAGVSRARNRGLAEARGQLIAYLDSDNAWVGEFVEVMVAFLDAEGLRAGYAGIELNTDEGIEYRGRPLHREALAERNYIDLNTVVHERSLAEELGGFDERLRRVVDWDLLIRMAGVTELGYAPFVGAHYDGSQERSDRITDVESVGYRHVVRHKHLVDLDAAPAIVPRVTSVLVVVRDGDPDPLATVRRWLDDAGGDLETIVVDDGGPRDRALRLRALAEADPRVRVERVADPTSIPVCIDLAASRARGDVLIHLDPGVQAPWEQLARLAAAVRAREADLVQPSLLEPSGRTIATGQRMAAHGVPVSLGTELGEVDPAMRADVSRDAVHGHAFAIDAQRFRALDGLDPLYVRGGGDLDLSLRLTSAGGRIAWTPDAGVVVDLAIRHVRWVPSYDDLRELRRRRPDPPAATLHVGDEQAGLRVAGLKVAHRTNRPGPKLHAVVHERAPGRPRPLRWAIKCTAPDVAERHEWGDWFFARALARALERLGQHVTVDCRLAWYRPTAHLDDVVLSLRGTRRYEPNPQHCNLSWVISHPERVTDDEVAVLDHVFVASVPFAQRLAARVVSVPVEPLLQCTDPSVFFPDPDPALAEDLLFVGNSRGQLRTVVRDALVAGLRPTIHGAGWSGLVPDELVASTHVPNHELRRHYSSARVVLNDHWEDMRAHGIVSNRIFDALACGATVVTDPVDGLPAAPEGRLRTYDGPDDLRRVVEEVTRREAALPSPWLALSEHTFDARAAALVETVDAHLRRSGDGAPPPDTDGRDRRA